MVDRIVDEQIQTGLTGSTIENNSGELAPQQIRIVDEQIQTIWPSAASTDPQTNSPGPNQENESGEPAPQQRETPSQQTGVPGLSTQIRPFLVNRLGDNLSDDW